MIRKILVTGSSGTIGTRLCEKLLEQEYEVIGADGKPNKWNKRINEITLITDLRNQEDTLTKLPKDVDLVIHMAANARVFNLVVDPNLARDNFETLFNVLEFTRINNIKKFIFTSSREVYGNSEKVVHNEEEAYVKNCESPYTATKVGGEALVHSYQQCYDIDFLILRFSNVYGIYDMSDRVIPLFISRALNNEDLFIYGKEKLLDYTYVDDTVKGVTKAITKFDQVKNNTFNISSGKGTTILEVAEIMKKELNSNSQIIIGDNRTGEVVKFIGNIDKARYLLDYEPEITIEEGVRRSIKWFKEYQEANENSNSN